MALATSDLDAAWSNLHAATAPGWQDLADLAGSRCWLPDWRPAR